jgi:hypothetical protein
MIARLKKYLKENSREGKLARIERYEQAHRDFIQGLLNEQKEEAANESS